MKRIKGIPVSALAAVPVLLAATALAPQDVFADPGSTAALEQRLRQMEQEMRMLRQEIQRVKEEAPAQQQQVQQLEQRVAKAEAAPPARKKNSMVFFRGGYADFRDDKARGFESFTDTHDTLGLIPSTHNPNDEGWYVGAAVEHSLTTDLWGIWPRTEALGEISLEWKRFGSKETTVVVPTAECALGVSAIKGSTGAGNLTVGDLAGCVVTGNDTITMFTVSAAPKIKFLEGSPIRPWIIPAGLDFHVISPPSDAATYLDVGLQVGAGVEFDIIPGIKAGLDTRFHLTADESNTKNNTVQVFNRNGLPATGSTDNSTDFWTAGGYLGFSF